MIPTCNSTSTVVLVHWNQAQDCIKTVAEFEAQSIETEIFVVDNGSKSDQIKTLRASLADRVEIIEVGANIGFGPGANVGLRRFLADTGHEWCFLAPHDVELGENCLAELIAAAANEPMAGLACADVGDGQSPVLDPYFGGITKTGGTDVGWEMVDYPHGTLMLLGRRCLQEIGLFDEDYFAYCEEAELGWRARNAGWKVGLVRGAMVRNRNLGTSIAAVDYLQTRNTLKLVRLTSGRYHVFIRIIISLIHVVHGKLDPSYAPPIFSPIARLTAIWHYLLGKSGRPPESLYELDAKREGL